MTLNHGWAAVQLVSSNWSRKWCCFNRSLSFLKRLVISLKIRPTAAERDVGSSWRLTFLFDFVTGAAVWLISVTVIISEKVSETNWVETNSCRRTESWWTQLCLNPLQDAQVSVSAASVRVCFCGCRPVCWRRRPELWWSAWWASVSQTPLTATCPLSWIFIQICVSDTLKRPSLYLSLTSLSNCKDVWLKSLSLDAFPWRLLWYLVLFICQIFPGWNHHVVHWVQSEILH